MKITFIKWLIFLAVWSGRATIISPVVAFVLMISTNISHRKIIWCVKKLFQIACILNLLAVFFYSTFGTG
jgi:hypothetical protein